MNAAPLTDALRRRLHALSTRGMREKYGQFIVEGRRIVEEALRSDWEVDAICTTASAASLLTGLPTRSRHVYTVDDSTFHEFSTTEHSQGIIAIVRAQHSALPTASDGLVIALDHVADPGNVGSIIRTADWFGANAVLLGAGCAEVFNPKTVRSTMGSIFHVPVVASPNLRESCAALKKDGFRLWCAAADGNVIGDAHRNAPRAVVIIGSEARGVSAELRAIADESIAVARRGRAESLNAAAAAAALLALLARQ